MMCNQFMGVKRQHPKVKEAAMYLMKKGVKWYKAGRVPEDEGPYYIYYASLAMFQYGGKEWLKWNKEMKRILLESQIKSGCNSPEPIIHSI